MLFYSRLLTVLALIECSLAATRKEVLPWFLWSNITEPVLALNPEELPYSKPSRFRPRQPPRRPIRPAFQEPDVSSLPVLQPPSTNVSNAASNLRFSVCCVCIPEYACVDGVSSLSNYDPDDFDINYEQCPYITDICCPLADAPEACKEVQKRSVDVVNSSIVPECECMHNDLCPRDLVIKFSPDDPRHLNTVCSNDHDVCCSLSDLPSGMENSENGVFEDSCLCVDPSVCHNIAHLLGYPEDEYLSYMDSNPSNHTCANSSEVCCSIPSTGTETTADRLLFQTPAVTYKDGETCFGYFASNQLPETDVSHLRPDQSQFGEMPWTVLFLDALGDVKGVGALIHPQAVLTIAHNFGEEAGGFAGVTAVFGEWDRSSTAEPLPQFEIGIEEIINHPLHATQPFMTHDAAIVILREPVRRMPHIQTICIAETLQQIDTNRCVSSGWGVLSPETQQFEDIMKRVQIPIMNDINQCQETLRGTGLGPELLLGNSTVCAGGVGGPGVCLGDQGAPMVCPSLDSSKYLLVGALSGGAECGVEGIPDIYTRYPGAVGEWVKNTIKNRFGILDVPIPKRNITATSQSSAGLSHTAGQFYYEDGVCRGYETVDVPQDVSSLLPTQSQQGEFPWTALLLNTTVGSEGIIGGGALIHPRVVLTTANRHARSSPADITVVLGEWDRHAQESHGRSYAVESLSVHPLFNQETIENDIMLIFLRDAVQTSSVVQSICLAQTFQEVDVTKCVVSGWGWGDSRRQENVVIQKRIQVPLVEPDVCVSQLQEVIPEFELYENYFCGGGLAAADSVCGGDEGAPLVCPSYSNGQYMLVGALSGGIECGAEGIPDIYKSYLNTTYDWIRETIIEKFPMKKETNATLDIMMSDSVSNSSSMSNVTTVPKPKPSDDETQTKKVEDHNSVTDGVELTEQMILSSASPLVGNKLSEDELSSLNVSIPAKSLMGSFGNQPCSPHVKLDKETSKIFGEQPQFSQFSEFPWVALIQTPVMPVWGAGALIHPRVVLTSASRATEISAEDIKVILGEHDLISNKKILPTQTMEVEAIKMHPNFNQLDGSNDIALLILKDSALASLNVQSICLASSLQDVDFSRCVVNGWGTEHPGTDQHVPLMKRVIKPIITTAECTDTLRSLTGDPQFNVSESHLCAGGQGGFSVCSGDEGSPLSCPTYSNSDHYLLLGVLSGGFDCGAPGVPDFYSSIIHHRDWLRKTVSESISKSEEHNSTVTILDQPLSDSTNMTDLASVHPSNNNRTIGTVTNDGTESVMTSTESTKDIVTPNKSDNGNEFTVRNPKEEKFEMVNRKSISSSNSLGSTETKKESRSILGTALSKEEVVPSVLGSFTKDSTCAGYQEMNQTSKTAFRFVQKGEFPWLATLTTSGGEHLGFGALVHPRAVVTSVQTLESTMPNKLKVSLSDKHNRLTLDVSDILLPEGDSSDSRIIILKETVEPTPLVQSICFSSSIFTVDVSQCVTPSLQISDVSRSPKKVEDIFRLKTSLMYPDECEYSRPNDVNISLSSICTAGEVPNCEGDEGAPLACPSYEDGHYRLVGSLSYAAACPSENFHVYYTAIDYESHVAAVNEYFIKGVGGILNELTGKKTIETEGGVEKRKPLNVLTPSIQENNQRKPLNVVAPTIQEDGQRKLHTVSIPTLEDDQRKTINVVAPTIQEDGQRKPHTVSNPTLEDGQQKPMNVVTPTIQENDQPESLDLGLKIFNQKFEMNTKSSIIFSDSTPKPDDGKVINKEPPKHNITMTEFKHHPRECTEDDYHSTTSSLRSSNHLKPKLVSRSYSNIARVQATSTNSLSKETKSNYYSKENCTNYEYFGSNAASPPGAGVHTAQSGEFPFMVTILSEEWRGNDLVTVLVGSGVLIRQNIVLTSASLVTKTNIHSVIVRLGDWDLTSDSEIWPHQDNAVAKVFVHPRFDSTRHSNDIALLTLKFSAKLRPNVQPICMADSFQDIDVMRCKTLGWGTVDQDEPSEKGLLKRLPSTLVPGEECEEQRLEKSTTRPEYLHQSFSCAVLNPSGSPVCLSKPGGVLVCPTYNNALYHLVGVENESDSCKKGTPSLFSTVVRSACGGHHSWIRRTVERISSSSSDTKSKVVLER